MSDATLSKLDELIKKAGYKSRSDCVKSLIEEKYSEVSAAEGLKNALLDLIKDDPDIFLALVDVVNQCLSEKESSLSL